MHQKLPPFSAIIILMIVLISCKQNNTADNSNLPVAMDDSSRIIIDRAIAYAGGYDAWQQKKTLSFDKKSISYDSTGKVTRELDQHLDYMMKPEFRAKIIYKQNDTTITLIHDGQKARKLYNGKATTEQKDIDNAWSLVLSSHYNMCMPYKLKDAGTKAEYIKITTLTDGEQAQEIKITYSKGTDKNKDQIWYYYFEPGTGKLLANSQKGKIWNYTRYESFEKAGGLLMPAIRKGSASNELNKSGKPTVESKNSNIVFDKEFAADHFKIKDDK